MYLVAILRVFMMHGVSKACNSRSCAPGLISGMQASMNIYHSTQLLMSRMLQSFLCIFHYKSKTEKVPRDIQGVKYICR